MVGVTAALGVNDVLGGVDKNFGQRGILPTDLRADLELERPKLVDGGDIATAAN